MTSGGHEAAGPALSLEWDDRILVVALSGEIDLASSDAFFHAIAEAIDARPLGVLVDLAAVTYLDSAGVRLLYMTHRETEQRRISLVAVLPRLQVVRRILSLAEVTAVIPVSDTRTEGLAHIKLDKAANTAAQLQHALDSRVIIEQAKGILAERHGVDLEEAFERMRIFSRRSRRSVRDIAGDVVCGALDVSA